MRTGGYLAGYETLIASHLPFATDLHLATAVNEIELTIRSVTLETSSARNRGSDSLLVDVELCAAHNARLEEVKLSTAIHLALHELQFGDLSLCLAVRPW